MEEKKDISAETSELGIECGVCLTVTYQCGPLSSDKCPMVLYYVILRETWVRGIQELWVIYAAFL